MQLPTLSSIKRKVRKKMVAKLMRLSLLTLAPLLIICILSLCSSGVVFSQNQTMENQPALKAAPVNTSTFAYNSLGKPDPFRPFINFNALERPIPTKEPKTPLERYSLNQFKLVGILLADKHFAMIEDPEHIGYTITEGDQLGNLSGTVEEIRENEIVIAEPYLDIYDQEQIRKVTIELHAKEDQGGKIQ